MTGAEQPIDQARLEGLARLMKADGYQRFIDGAERAAADQLSQLVAAGSDGEAVSRAIHGLKGLLANLGMAAAEAQVRRLSRPPTPEELTALEDAIRTAMAAARAIA
ncbi:MAG: Hpt domain-containing protein [Alphaproteobacteria bacterium]|nr:Hpt domain-containing protein [Alphaproteobacteria bacterium]